MLKINKETAEKIVDELDKLDVEIVKIDDTNYNFNNITDIELEKSTQALEELKNIVEKSNKIIENYKEIKNINFENIKIGNEEQLLKIAGIIFENIGAYEKEELYRSFWFLWKLLIDSLDAATINLNNFLNVKKYGKETLTKNLEDIIGKNVKIWTGKELYSILESYYCKSNSTYNGKKIKEYIVESCKSWLPDGENKCGYLKNNKTRNIHGTCLQQELCFRVIVCTGYEIVHKERFSNDLNNLISNVLIYYDYLGRKSMQKIDELIERRARENVARKYGIFTKPRFVGIPEIGTLWRREERVPPSVATELPTRQLFGGYRKDKMYMDFLNSLDKNIYSKEMRGIEREKLAKILKKYQGIYSRDVSKILNKIKKV